MFLNTVEAAAIDAQIRRLESRTGIQVVTAVVGKSDSYAELPWKAFALGAALGGLIVVLADWARPQWVTAQTALLAVTVVLGIAAAGALLSVFVPPVARLFLGAVRRDLEVRQHAQAMFLTRELFKTDARLGVLVLVSLFERVVEVLPDVGFRSRVREEDWDAVIERMMPALRLARPADALGAGLSALEDLLVAKGFQPGDGRNELPDHPVEERGV